MWCLKVSKSPFCPNPLPFDRPKSFSIPPTFIPFSPELQYHAWIQLLCRGEGIIHCLCGKEETESGEKKEKYKRILLFNKGFFIPMRLYDSLMGNLDCYKDKSTFPRLKRIFYHFQVIFVIYFKWYFIVEALIRSLYRSTAEMRRTDNALQRVT